LDTGGHRKLRFPSHHARLRVAQRRADVKTTPIFGHHLLLALVAVRTHAPRHLALAIPLLVLHLLLTVLSGLVAQHRAQPSVFKPMDETGLSRWS
jgi:hypothetical protein